MECRYIQCVCVCPPKWQEQIIPFGARYDILKDTFKVDFMIFTKLFTISALLTLSSVYIYFLPHKTRIQHPEYSRALNYLYCANLQSILELELLGITNLSYIRQDLSSIDPHLALGINISQPPRSLCTLDCTNANLNSNST